MKAPTLVTDDGFVPMDSTQILAWAERLAEPERRLQPADDKQRLRSLCVSGLALAACEKTVQIVYELNLRPADKRHQPWLDCVGAQLQAAYRLLDDALPAEGWTGGGRLAQGDVDAAVAWRFTREVLIDQAIDHTPELSHQGRLAAVADRAEGLPAFRAAVTT